MAPLFHITGLIAHIAVSFLLPAHWCSAYRFERGCCSTRSGSTGLRSPSRAITVFIALANTPGVTREDLASLRAAYSGGAPITPA